MERFFILDKFNTFYDWRLILTAKDVAFPEPKTKLIELDGMSGTLDLSEVLTGEITYKDRTISATFWTDEGSRQDRERLLQTIVNVLHGKKIKIIEPDDPEHYFYGRVKIKSQKNNLAYAEFSIECTCDPWRYALNDSVRRVEVNSQSVTEVIIPNNGAKSLSPDITVTGFVNINYDGLNITLESGSYKIADIKLQSGVNIIGVSGNGTVTFTYKEANL